MRNIFAFLILLCALSADAQSTNRIRWTVTVTNVAITGYTNVINGAARIFTNAHTSSTILTNLTGPAGTATNLWDNYTRATIGSGVTHRMIGTNAIEFTAPFGASLSGSVIGPWGYGVLSTQSGPTTFTALWPMQNMVGETNRTNQGSSLVSGLSAYSTNAFATNATALSNHITKGASPPQYVTSELRLSGNLNNGTGNLSVSNLVNSGNAIRSDGAGGNSLQIGSNAVAAGSISLAIGNSSLATNTTTLAVGTSAKATNDYAMAVGNNATAGGTDSFAVGRGALALGTGAQAIGQASLAQGLGAIAIESETVGDLSISIGPGSSVSATNSTALGSSATVNHNNSTAIGYSATTTSTNQVRLGTTDETVSIPGVLAVSGSLTNSTLKGTNIVNGRLDFTAGLRTSLANGYNSGTILGTNVYLRMSGPTAAYTNAGFAASVDGTWHKLQFDNPGLSCTILDSSGLEATAANRILTGTGALVNSTNNPAFFELIYDGSASRWRLISFR